MRTLNYRSAEDNARGAAINAAYRNEQMRGTYTPAEQNAAQRVIDMLDLAYNATFFINYRKTFIAVKAAQVEAKGKAIAKEVIKLLEAKGYTIINTKQGIVVRIMR